LRLATVSDLLRSYSRLRGVEGHWVSVRLQQQGSGMSGVKVVVEHPMHGRVLLGAGVDGPG
jgi:hypothetical protein